MNRYMLYFGFIIIIVLIFSLYRAKYGAQESAAALQTIEREIADAKAERTDLLAELSHLTRQEWLAEYARNELGMGPPKAEQYITIAELDDLIGPAAPTSEDAGLETAGDSDAEQAR